MVFSNLKYVDIWVLITHFLSVLLSVQLDFQGANLMGANLSGANLEGANLKVTKMTPFNLHFHPACHM